MQRTPAAQTGTLTENRMSVVEGWFAGTKSSHSPTAAELAPGLLEELRVNIAMNSKAFLTETDNGRVGYIGSSTECALLLQLRSWGHDYSEVRAELEKDVIQVGGSDRGLKDLLCPLLLIVPPFPSPSPQPDPSSPLGSAYVSPFPSLSPLPSHL